MTNKEKEISIPTVEDTSKKFPTPSDNLVTMLAPESAEAEAFRIRLTK